MPSPFPGMDPYLENPRRWPNIHNGLIAASQDLLNRLLRPKYVACVEERVYVEADGDAARELHFVPDVSVANGSGGKRAKAVGHRISTPVLVTHDPGLRIRERRIEIRTADSQTVVSVIEFLSPSNKVSGAAGRKSFQKKRRQILASSAHWVEIDLLRQGEAFGFRSRFAEYEYLVTSLPADLRPDGLAWPIRLTDPLPTIGIPLRKPDADVPLDLQQVLSLAYERGAFEVIVDYRKDPVPPLPPALAKWADALLKKKKLR